MKEQKTFRERGEYRSPHVAGQPASSGERFLFILVEPAFTGNIGAACRAIKTMGFTRMAVVRGPHRFKDDPEARRLAHNANEILDAALECDSIESATTGLHHLIGTTHRPRAMQFPASRTVRTLAVSVAREIQSRPETCCGILFGSENRGLTDAELALCQDVTSIPAAVTQPSLNLAQAVQIVAYELFLATLACEDAPTPLSVVMPSPVPTVHELHALVHHMEDTLEKMGFANRHSGPDRFRAALVRMLSRANLQPQDLRLIHRLLQQADRFIESHRTLNEEGGGDSNSRTRPSG